jgi:hypothetical protein
MERALSYGEQACGVDLYTKEDPVVADLRDRFAAIIDELNEARKRSSHERARLLSIAITEAQGAQMWAVKAVTYEYYLES